MTPCKWLDGSGRLMVHARSESVARSSSDACPIESGAANVGAYRVFHDVVAPTSTQRASVSARLPSRSFARAAVAASLTRASLSFSRADNRLSESELDNSPRFLLDQATVHRPPLPLFLRPGDLSGSPPKRSREFDQVLRGLRHRMGLTQGALAERIGATNDRPNLAKTGTT